MRTKFKDEKKALLKEHGIEIKSWKKDLGRANSNLIKLGKKLEVTESNLASQSLVSGRNASSVSDSDPVISSPPASVHAVCSSPCTPPGWTTCILQSARNSEKKIEAENERKTNEEDYVVENNNYEERSAIENNSNAENIVIENDAYNERNVKPKCLLSTEIQEILKSEKLDFEKLVEAVRRDKIGLDLPNDGEEDYGYSNYEYEDYPHEYWDTEIQDVTDEAIDDQNLDKI